MILTLSLSHCSSTDFIAIGGAVFTGLEDKPNPVGAIRMLNKQKEKIVTDLEERIEQLEKQKELLKTACKKAGARIKDLERDREIFKKEIDRLSEYSQNLERILKK